MKDETKLQMLIGALVLLGGTIVVGFCQLGDKFAKLNNKPREK